MGRIYDVVVIGAGPVGSYTAYQLAKEGLEVLIIDRNETFTRPPVCTGVIGVEVFEKFELPEDSVISQIKDIAFFSPTGLKVVYQPKSNLAYVVDRVKFDQALRGLALKNGARIQLNSLAKGIHFKDSHLEIEIANQSQLIRSRGVVVATGANQNLTHKLGLGRFPDYVFGAQTEVRMEGVSETEIYLGNRISPGAFAWVVKIGEEKARIGLVTRENAREYLENFLNNQVIRDRLKEKGEIQGRAIPMGSLPRTSGERILVVGEAAGQVKTTTHGGIYYGLICSRIAVETLKEAFEKGKFSSQILRNYDKRWKGLLEREIKSGYWLKKFYSRINDSQIDELFRIAISDGIMDIVHQKARFDWHGELIATLVKHCLQENYFQRIKLGISRFIFGGLTS